MRLAEIRQQGLATAAGGFAEADQRIELALLADRVEDGDPALLEFAQKEADQWLVTSYEREVIRPHALGKDGMRVRAERVEPAHVRAGIARSAGQRLADARARPALTGPSVVRRAGDELLS